MTVRQRLTDIALAITGQGIAGGGDTSLSDRYVTAVERIADCLCRDVTITAGAGAGCLPIVTNSGGVVQFPVALENGGTNYSVPATIADYVRVTFPEGEWRLSVLINRASGEYGQLTMTRYTSKHGYSASFLTDDSTAYNFDISGGGWVNLAPSSTGYNSWIVSASFCQRPASAPSGAAVILANGEMGRVLNTTKPPKPGRPFFGPADWQPDATVSFVDVATAVATDIQNIAEALADQLDPTDDFIATFREIGQFGQVIQSADYETVWGDILTGDTFGATFANSLSYGSKVQLTVDAAGGLSTLQKALLAGVELNMRLEP